MRLYNDYLGRSFNFLIDEKINASLNSFDCPLIIILFHFFLYLDQFLFKRGGGENNNTYITHVKKKDI